MARRRYRSDAISHAGRREQPRDPQTVGEEYPRGSEAAAPEARPREEYGKPEPDQSAQHFSTGLKDQLEAQRRYAQPDPIDAFINQHYSGALPHERQWLRDHPEHMQHVQLVHAAGMIALQRGVPRHSPEFLHAIEQLIAQHHAAMQAQPPPPPPMHAPPPPAPPMPPMPHHIELEAEHDDEPEQPSMAHHYAAPVSHGTGGVFEPELTSPSQVKLTAEQRDMARRSMPHLSHDEAEKTYAANFLKMEKAKKAKLIE
jgi:hypothetical protein